MKLEHVAIWTNQLERLKDFYVTHFGAVPNDKYTNTSKAFESYFLTFSSGARLELMQKPGVSQNLNNTVEQYLGIIHLAFEVKTMKEVDEKVEVFKKAGFPILNGLRKTGDGYYEFETLDPGNNRLEVTTLWAD